MKMFVLKSNYSDETLFIKRIYYFFTIIGLTAINVRTKYTKNSKSCALWFARSKIGLAYNVFLIFSLVALNYFSVKYTSESSSRGKIMYEVIIDNAQNFMTILTTVLVLTIYCIQHKKTVVIANKMKILREITMNLNYGLSNKKLPISGSIKKICLANGVVWILMIVTSKMDSFGVAMYQAAILPCTLIINCTFIQYSVMLLFMKQIFGVLNANFQFISKKTIAIKQIQLVDGDRTGMAAFSDLRELYSTLCDLSEDLSDFYSYMMLLCISYTFINLIISLYYVVRPILIADPGWPIIDGYIHCSVFVLYRVVILIILTRSVGAVIIESKRTGEIVNKWLLVMQNQHVINQLNQFSNYLLHKKIQFSVFGLFSLDESLLMSIIGAITTYLVILLQFYGNNSV